MSEKKSLLRKLISTAAGSGVIKIFGTGLAFLLFSLFARLLEQDEYGILAVGFSTALLLGTITSLGQDSAVLRFWPSTEETLGREAANKVLLYSLKLVGSSCTTLLFLAVLFSLFNISPPGIKFDGTALLAVGVLACCYALANFASAALRAQGSVYWALIPMDMAWRVITLVSAYSLGIKTGQTATWMAALVLLLVIVPQYKLLLGTLMKESSRAGDAAKITGTVSKIRKATIGLWGIAIANSVGQNAATIAVGATLGPAEAGGFFAATRLSQLMTIFLVAINQAFGPMLSRSWHSGRAGEARTLYLGATIFSFLGALSIFIVFLVWGQHFLSLFGDTYTKFKPILVILSLGQLVNTACGPNRAFLMMIGRERALFILVFLTSLALPIFLPISTKIYGSMGAAMLVSSLLAILNLAAVGLLYKAGFKTPIKPKQNR
ncbi:lipopolysaccharide biosynthesis protein [Celeribacter sp.]|uniref:lipopolysaccharide biosynthesis protein n=1 Tax=Celeribacter sp. TaxID=1890673 RepID=UPI003A9086E5